MASTRRTTTLTQRLGKTTQVPIVKPVKRAGGQMAPTEAKKKRTAFVDLTNASTKLQNAVTMAKKQGIKVAPGKRKAKVVVAVPKAAKPVTLSQENKEDLSWDIIELSPAVSLSSQQSEASQPCSQNTVISSQTSNDSESVTSEDLDLTEKAVVSPKLSYDDVDTENMADPFQVALYAQDIFRHYKEREAKFAIPDYMLAQADLTPHMRTILVDWLVEVQENFELNHETLYLAVKLVDLYLCQKPVARDQLQLVGATTLFIACKFDERCPPVLDDFLYICDDAYKREEIIRMEIAILHAIDFDLGIPLSYRFLRRYSKCARANMETLTLGRYILERSLMDYRFTRQPDSKMAAAALLLALSMKKCGTWNATMEYYSGYKVEEILPFVARLNKMVSSKTHKNLTTILSKYSHKVFHEVAKSKPLNADELANLGITVEMATAANTSTSSSSSSCNDSS